MSTCCWFCQLFKDRYLLTSIRDNLSAITLSFPVIYRISVENCPIKSRWQACLGKLRSKSCWKVYISGLYICGLCIISVLLNVGNVWLLCKLPRVFDHKGCILFAPYSISCSCQWLPFFVSCTECCVRSVDDQRNRDFGSRVCQEYSFCKTVVAILKRLL